jgi:hypothetical protein
VAPMAPHRARMVELAPLRFAQAFAPLLNRVAVLGA